jgi:CheY-like chemotaxis protein
MTFRAATSNNTAPPLHSSAGSFYALCMTSLWSADSKNYRPSQQRFPFLCAAAYNGAMAKVLLVDDEADHTGSLAKVLRAIGHEVATAPNGRDALAHIIGNLPDVVLLDLLMPVMDGPSFLETVRSYTRLQSLPVVVLTALTDSPLIERTRALKVNCILSKGKATSDDVQKAINEALAGMPS